MVKMVTVTRVGQNMIDNGNTEILINADNVNQIRSVEGSVEKSKIIFNDDSVVNVVESQHELESILNN